MNTLSPTSARPPVQPHRRPLGVVALTLALLATGCSASRSSAASPFEGGTDQGSTSEQSIRVEVQNLNFNDATVWALRQGQRIRIGRVTGKSDRTFRVSWNLALPISFIVDFTGGGICSTQRVGIDRDAIVWLSIPADIDAQPCNIGRR